MKHAKKVISLLLALALCACLLAACGGGKNSGDPTSDAPADLLAKIREKGSVTIAMEGTWAPWTYHDEADRLVGYDVEVGQKIAEKLGVEAEFI